MFPSYIYLLWKPLHIPSASSLDIPDDKLKILEVEGGDSIKANIKEDERPLKEGIYGICWMN